MLLIVLEKSKENTGTIPEKKLNLVQSRHVNKNVGLNLNSNYLLLVLVIAIMQVHI